MPMFLFVRVVLRLLLVLVAFPTKYVKWFNWESILTLMSSSSSRCSSCNDRFCRCSSLARFCVTSISLSSRFCLFSVTRNLAMAPPCSFSYRISFDLNKLTRLVGGGSDDGVQVLNLERKSRIPVLTVSNFWTLSDLKLGHKWITWENN